MDISMIDINAYIVPLALIAALCVGFIVKHLIPSTRINNFIPLIVAVVGILVVCLTQGWTVEGIVYGMVSGLASVGLYEVFAQLIEAKNIQTCMKALEEREDEDMRDKAGE